MTKLRMVNNLIMANKAIKINIWSEIDKEVCRKEVRLV